MQFVATAEGFNLILKESGKTKHHRCFSLLPFCQTWMNKCFNLNSNGIRYINVTFGFESLLTERFCFIASSIFFINIPSIFDNDTQFGMEKFNSIRFS